MKLVTYNIVIGAIMLILVIVAICPTSQILTMVLNVHTVPMKVVRYVSVIMNVSNAMNQQTISERSIIYVWNVSKIFLLIFKQILVYPVQWKIVSFVRIKPFALCVTNLTL